MNEMKSWARQSTTWMMVLALLMAMLPLPALNQQTTVVQANSSTALSVGNYIQFGKYNGQPILWRIIKKDEAGNPLLLADRVLSFKFFDAKGSAYDGNASRVQYGSNFYANSTIRQWLNSDQSSIDWTLNEPSSNQTIDGYNGYQSEKGFLANGNFSAGERAMILPLTHNVLLSGTEVAQNYQTSGSAYHTNFSTIETATSNYDNAYQHPVTDKVLLLSIKQLKEWVADQSATLGTDYFKAKATQQAIDGNVRWSAEPENKPTTDGFVNYLLNTPVSVSDANNSSGQAAVRYVADSGTIGYNFAAYTPTGGIRPALQLDASKLVFKTGGSGTAQTPYVVYTTPELQVGDYLKFGSLYGAPIVWRVVDFDEQGDPLLFSDRIISFKAFDVPGPYHAADQNRYQYGSSFYRDSNLRQWLNSASINKGKDQIKWLQNKPTGGGFANGPYESGQLSGFLQNEYFSASERGMMKPLTHKSLLAELDADFASFGIETYAPGGPGESVADAVANYDNAYGMNVTDQVFIPSLKQLKVHVVDQSDQLGGDYMLAKPTQQAIDNSFFKTYTPINESDKVPNVDKWWQYWTNTPYTPVGHAVKSIDPFEPLGFGEEPPPPVATVGAPSANDMRVGVRPMVYLNKNKIKFNQTGEGTLQSPYEINKAPSITQVEVHPSGKQVRLTFDMPIVNAMPGANAVAKLDALRAVIQLSKNANSQNPTFTALTQAEKISISGSFMMITFTNALNTQSNQFRIPANALTDKSGKLNVTMLSPVFNADLTGPEIDSVALDSTRKVISITLTEAATINPALGVASVRTTAFKNKILINRDGGDDAFVELAGTDKVSLSKTKLTISLTNALTGPENFIKISENAFQDVVPNLNTNALTTTAINAVLDPVITVSSLNPTNRELTLNFNEPLKYGTTGPATSQIAELKKKVKISLNEQSPVALAQGDNLVLSKNVLKITFAIPLTTSSNKVSVEAGAVSNAVGQLNKAEILSPVFHADTSAPELVGLVEVSKDKSSVVLTFNENPILNTTASTALLKSAFLKNGISFSSNAYSPFPNYSGTNIKGVTLAKNKLTVVFLTPLSGSQNRIRISENVFKDVAENKNPEITSRFFAPQ